jgi:uncharacterized delta-60 repeat protein
MRRRPRIRRRAALAAAAATFAALGGAANVAASAPGDIDRSFGGGTGSVLVGFGPGSLDRARALALQPDGRIVVAGYSNANGSNDFAVARLLGTGVLDRSFGGGTGTSLGGFAPGSSDVANAVVLQPDGAVVLAGHSNAGGTVDIAVARLRTPDGTFDPTYGGGTGRSLGGFTATSHETASAIALQPDGRIVVAGGTDAAGTADIAVARLGNPDGGFDATFGGGTGRAIGGVGPATGDHAQAVALQPDGGIVVAGASESDDGPRMVLARLRSPEGTFDPSFGGTGRAIPRFGVESFDGAAAVAVQPDGRILAAGNSNARGTVDIAVARVAPDGDPDTSFGAGNGKALVGFRATSNEAAQAMALQADGKILLAGTTDGDVAVVRLQPNGGLDATFGDGGTVRVDLGGPDDIAFAMAVQPDGRIVLAGETRAGGSEDMVVVRLQGDPPVAGSGGGGAAGGGGGAGGPAGSPPACLGRPATIVGTAAADRLRGTSRADVIVALGGADRIAALGGDDLVCAGGGDDVVTGGAGADVLRGESGRDHLIGGRGRDRLTGGAGADRLVGGPGRDLLTGQPGRDRERR